MPSNFSQRLSILSRVLGAIPLEAEADLLSEGPEAARSLLSSAIMAINKKSGDTAKTLSYAETRVGPGGIRSYEIRGSKLAYWLSTGTMPHRIYPRAGRYQNISQTKGGKIRRTGTMGGHMAVKWTNKRGQTYIAAYAPHPGTPAYFWRRTARSDAAPMVVAAGVAAGNKTRQRIKQALGGLWG